MAYRGGSRGLTDRIRALRPVVLNGEQRRRYAGHGRCTRHRAESSRLTQVGDLTSTIIERSGPAIRTALRAHAPERCAQFEAELRSALARAAENLDLAGPQAVLKHWHALATMAANPPTDEERDQIERAKTGDYTGLSTRDENGNWVRL
jgi:hypothetical protein